MDDLRFYDLLNSISVISGRLADDNERAVCNETPFTYIDGQKGKHL